MKKMTEFVRDAEKRKNVTFRIKCNVVCAKRYAIIYPNFRIVVKMHKKQRKKCTKLTKN